MSKGESVTGSPHDKVRMTPATPLDHALALAAMGFPVFPCIEGGKLPAIKGWRTRATTDEQQIRFWWRSPTDEETAARPEWRPHRRNIGVATGHPFGGGYLTVVDLDMKPGQDGKMDLAMLEMEHGALPATFSTITPSLGRHLYFVTKAPVRSSVKHVAPGIDIRGVGGYVVGPGSATAAGRYVRG